MFIFFADAVVFWSPGAEDRVVAEIHEENLARLAALTPAQVEQERQQLLATTDPALIDFLKQYSSRQARSRNVAQALAVEEALHPGILKKKLRAHKTSSDLAGSKDLDGDIEEMDTSDETRVQVTENDDNDSATVAEEDGNTEVMSTEGPIDDSELPIPPDEAKKWVHMDKVSFMTLFSICT